MSKEYLLLPEEKNFLRIKDCDFNTFEDNQNLKSSKIFATLKNIRNPILILFYYNDTDKKILTEFFESRRFSELEDGDKKDYIFGTENDTDFKLGFVNLDLESNILQVFREIKPINPFVWCRIEKDGPDYLKVPFILFYYDTFPQFMYEGVVSSQIIRKEFKNWRSELREMENIELRNIKKEEERKEGYYKALKNDYPIKGIVAGQNYFITTTRTSTGGLDYSMVPI